MFLIHIWMEINKEDRRVCCLLLIVCCLLSLNACGPAPTVERTGGNDGVLRVAIPSDARTLDPAIAYDIVTWPLVRAMFHGLIDYDDDLNLIPWQSREWTTSDDGRVLTFYLQSGVRFANGREVNAADYVYTLERILNPATKSPGQGFYRNISGVQDFQDGKTPHVRGLRAPGRYTFVVELEQPDPTFLHVLAMPFAYVVPEEEVNRSEDFAQRPVGTGPFNLVEWRRGARLRFERNPMYAHQKEIKLDAFELMVGGDGALHMMMFERGELDIANVTAIGIPDPDFVRVMQDPRLSRYVDSQPLNAIGYLSMNTEMPPFDSIEVRQAMNYAIDKRHLIRLMSERGTPARGVLPPGMPGYNPDLKGYAYNPEKARQLLYKAGHPDGFSTELWINAATNTEVRQAQAIQQDLKKIGVTVVIKAVTGATRIEAIGRRGTVPFALFGWYQDYPDPSNFLDVLLNGRRITDVNSNNVAFYNNPEVNALLDEAAFEADRQRRLSLYQEAEVLIVRDAPWVFLYHPNMYILRQPWLKGLDLNPVWPIRYERMWIERD